MEASEVSSERLSCMHVGVGVIRWGVERMVVVLKERKGVFMAR